MGERYALIHAEVLDGTKDMEVQHDKVVLIDGDRIAGVVNADADTTGYEVIDLNYQYVMPGLVNLHVHLPATGKPKKKESDPKKTVGILAKYGFARKAAYSMFKKVLAEEVLSGVTTIRTVGGVFDFDTRYRDDVRAKKMIGPRVVASNMAISVPGGHMVDSLAYSARSVEDARSYSKIIIESGADLLKLMVTGGVMDAEEKGGAGKLKMPAEYIRVACEEAHAHGLKVAAHCESTEGVKVALENGVDTIEHGARTDDEIIRLFKEHNACDVATLTPTIPYAMFDRNITGVNEVQQYNGQFVMDGVINCAKACLENDIPVGLGIDTGCPYSTHYNMWLELVLFHHYCEVSNAFALHTATLGNAKIAGLDSEIGSIEAGKYADLIISAKNPLDDLTALRQLTGVIADGEWMDIAKLKKYDAVEKEWDQFLTKEGIIQKPTTW